MKTPAADLADIERETFRSLAHYTRCIDTQNWMGLHEVFDANCIKERLGPDGLRGGALVAGADEIIADLSASLGACGPTQHLLGNHVASLCDDGDAESLTYVRAFHRGKGGHSEFWLDVFGEYRLRWRLTSLGWRAVRWSLHISSSIGDRRALDLSA